MSEKKRTEYELHQNEMAVPPSSRPSLAATIASFFTRQLAKSTRHPIGSQFGLLTLISLGSAIFFGKRAAYEAMYLETHSVQELLRGQKAEQWAKEEANHQLASPIITDTQRQDWHPLITAGLQEYAARTGNLNLTNIPSLEETRSFYKWLDLLQHEGKKEQYQQHYASFITKSPSLNPTYLMNRSGKEWSHAASFHKSSKEEAQIMKKELSLASSTGDIANLLTELKMRDISIPNKNDASTKWEEWLANISSDLAKKQFQEGAYCKKKGGYSYQVASKTIIEHSAGKEKASLLKEITPPMSVQK
jgi:hypothetical protein